MIYCCVLRLWSLIYVRFQSCWYLDEVALFRCVGTACLELMGWQLVGERWIRNILPTKVSVVVANCLYLGFVVPDRAFMFSDCNPDLDERIYDCLLTSMAVV